VSEEDTSERLGTERGSDPVRPASHGGHVLPELRVGIGVDAHAFADGVPLVLGGARFDEHPRGLAGHSDGDVIAHALTDAVLGAAGLGDIGSLFPSDDERWRGADSVELLRDAWGRVAADGWTLVNADCVLVGEEPRIAARRDEMTALLADALGVLPDRVSVRATTTDGLGFPGRGEGLAAHAVALLSR
jgi:2-C-methyl-D-erythritol 2,4-cyclodiphosphate synthase